MTMAVLGDSIPGGTWLRHPERDSFISRLRNGAGPVGQYWTADVDDYSHGGASYTDPNNSIMAQATALVASGKAYEDILIMAGTNDLVSNYTVDPIANAVRQVVNKLAGRTLIFTTILPLGLGSSHPDGWVPALGQRQQSFNQWLIGSGYTVTDWSGIWGEVGGVISPAYNFMLLDGLHPSRNGVLDLLTMLK